MGSFDRVALCAHALVHMLLCSVNIMKCLGTGRSSNSAAGQPQAIRPLFVFAAAANQAPGHTPDPQAGQATAEPYCLRLRPGAGPGAGWPARPPAKPSPQPAKEALPATLTGRRGAGRGGAMDGQSGGRGVYSQGAQARAHTSRTPRSRRKRHMKNRKRSGTYTGLFLTRFRVCKHGERSTR